MKKFLAIVFLSIFIFQMLPVKAIGKILWSGQMTEEVHEHGPCHKKIANEPNKFWYLDFISATAEEVPSATSNILDLRDEALIKCLHLDVPLQPPNLH